jgi:hypothetical protein
MPLANSGVGQVPFHFTAVLWNVSFGRRKVRVVVHACAYRLFLNIPVRFYFGDNFGGALSWLPMAKCLKRAGV